MAPFLVTVNFAHFAVILTSIYFVFTSKPSSISNIVLFLFLVFCNTFFLLSRLLFKRALKKHPFKSPTDGKEVAKELRILYRKCAKKALKVSAIITILLAMKMIIQHAL